MFLQRDIENKTQITLLVGNYKRPTPGILVLHSLQKENSDCHLLISCLKELIQLSTFTLSGIKFHILGPTFDLLSEPWQTKFILGIAKWLGFLKL